MLTEFGRECRKLRIDNNELLADMANKLNVSASFLSAIENGKKNIPNSFLEDLIRVYDLDSALERKMREAADRSISQIKIEMKAMEQSDRDLVMAFARKFENLAIEDKNKILKLLNK